jgi:predicted pyridoxine 5'-phosphate oxidase superfamily flavin-nucleotide-binding protein
MELNRAQQKFGEPVESTRKKIFDHLNPMIRDFIGAAPFAVVATANADGDCDASPKGGHPGFVKVLDETRLMVPDIAGNKLFQSYENVDSNPNAGLVFLIPGCDWTVRVNGRARVIDSAARELDGATPEVLWKDDNTKVLQGLLLDVVEAYAHCPRAFLFAKLWDVDRLAENLASDPNKYWFGRYQESRKAS